jgi:hypothetical protein
MMATGKQQTHISAWTEWTSESISAHVILSDHESRSLGLRLLLIYIDLDGLLIQTLVTFP